MTAAAHQVVDTLYRLEAVLGYAVKVVEETRDQVNVRVFAIDEDEGPVTDVDRQIATIRDGLTAQTRALAAAACALDEAMARRHPPVSDPEDTIALVEADTLERLLRRIARVADCTFPLTAGEYRAAQV